MMAGLNGGKGHCVTIWRIARILGERTVVRADSWVVGKYWGMLLTDK